MHSLPTRQNLDRSRKNGRSRVGREGRMRRMGTDAEPSARDRAREWKGGNLSRPCARRAGRGGGEGRGGKPAARDGAGEGRGGTLSRPGARRAGRGGPEGKGGNRDVPVCSTDRAGGGAAACRRMWRPGPVLPPRPTPPRRSPRTP